MEISRLPIQVYIENATESTIGGFTISLPIDRKALESWLNAIEVTDFKESDMAIREVRSQIPVLHNALKEIEPDQIHFDELNYLATKISNLDEENMDIFLSAIDAGLNVRTIPALINLAENTDHFDWQPAYNEEQYGEFIAEHRKDEYSSGISQLMNSGDSELSDVAEYIKRLEQHVDFKALGEHTAKEENGFFTRYGYIQQSGELSENYHGLSDLPIEYRIFSNLEPPLIAMDVDIPAFLAELHNTVGDYDRDLKYNLKVLNRLKSSEYLLLLDSKTGAYLTETAHAYRHDTDAYNLWMNISPDSHTTGFSIHLTEVHGHIFGNVSQVDIAELQMDIANNCIYPYRIDAFLPNGEPVSYTPEEWMMISPSECEALLDWDRRFHDYDFAAVFKHIEALYNQDDRRNKTVAAEELILRENTAYMQQAQYPQSDMLRISQTAAKEMLVHGEAEIYRLLPSGAEKLVPIDAIRHGLWFSQNREFAIKKEDLPKLDRWAERTAEKAAEHKKPNKTKHEPER